MSMEVNKALIQRFFAEVVSQGDQESVDELVADSCRYFDAGTLKTTGCVEFKAYLIEALKPIESLDMEIDNMVAEGNQVAVRCSYYVLLAGEHSCVPVMADFRIEEGKIVEMWRMIAH